jgi:hypothetical protein
MSKSPKADRATLDKVSKLLPLLNSAKTALRQLDGGNNGNP